MDFFFRRIKQLQSKSYLDSASVKFFSNVLRDIHFLTFTQKPKRSSNTTMPTYLLLPMSIMTILLLLCCRASSSQVVRWLKVSRRVMSYTSSAPAAPRQYDRVMLRKASWPAVSQICSLICFPSIVIMRAPNSTPGDNTRLTRQ